MPYCHTAATRVDSIIKLYVLYNSYDSVVTYDNHILWKKHAEPLWIKIRLMAVMILNVTFAQSLSSLALGLWSNLRVMHSALNRHGKNMFEAFIL